ncbi:MAG: hypothetical protein JWN34_4009 [Bryobacterales bacterium]|nr:hypothetical protein [Bryobacterales bacterium]
MNAKSYSVFGAGAAGLYTAWRLVGGGSQEDQKPNRRALQRGDTLELYDWGKYTFGSEQPGTRAAGARVCTWHYEDDTTASYVEVGGMRYSEWDGSKDGGGHRLVTTVIQKLGLKEDSVPFNESTNPLYYLRAKNVYLNDITASNPAPYNVNNYGATDSPDQGFGIIQDIAVTPDKAAKMTRQDWCKFYKEGTIQAELGDASIYRKGERLSDIGYWNLMFDQLGSEGYQYTADGNGYTSNVINWNAADAIESNNEFAPGTKYKTLKTGYSSMFSFLFQAVADLAAEQGIHFRYHPQTRLHSVLEIKGKVHYWTATREHPDKANGEHITDAAWLAMPRHALELVSRATRYQQHNGLDVLNHPRVQLYMESAILQPSYKVGMFFDQEWWVKGAAAAPVYPAPITGYEITQQVLKSLPASAFSQEDIKRLHDSPTIFEQPFASEVDFIAAIENCLDERCTVVQQKLLLSLSQRNTIGPSVTDTPIRQVVYFGNNAVGDKEKPVYGLLASYDDEQFTTFWEELEIGPEGSRKVAPSENYQPLEGPRTVPPGMVKMLRSQLAALHFGPGANYDSVPEPLQSKYMDWSLPPFGAGYHAWSAHYDIGDVQQKLRKPSQLIDGADASIFIVGETYSNDQAWVEGAYCTSESVLNDFFGFEPIISNKDYPFICGA